MLDLCQVRHVYMSVCDHEGKKVLSGNRNAEIKLRMIDLEETTQSLPAAPIQHTAIASVEHSASLVVKLDSQAEVAKFWHATFGSSAISTFHTVFRKGLITIPGVTPKMMRKYVPDSVVNSLGPLDQTKQGQQSTRRAVECDSMIQPSAPKSAKPTKAVFI